MVTPTELVSKLKTFKKTEINNGNTLGLLYKRPSYCIIICKKQNKVVLTVVALWSTQRGFFMRDPSSSFPLQKELVLMSSWRPIALS